MKQLSWERSGTPERTAAVPTLCWYPLCPQPCSPFLWPPQSRPFQTRNVQSSHGPSRSGARQERRGKRQGTQSPTPTAWARRTLPAGGAGQRTRPYLSFPPGPHLRRRARPVATAARFPWSPRVSSLPGEAAFGSPGLIRGRRSPTGCEATALAATRSGTQAPVQVNCRRPGRRWPPGPTPGALARSGLAHCEGSGGRLLRAALELPRRLARAVRDEGRLGWRRRD